MPAGREIFKLFGLIGLSGVEKTNAELKALDKQARKVQSEINKMGRAIAETGAKLTKFFTLPLAAAAAAVVKVSGDFDAAFTKSLAIMGDVSDAMRKDMRAAAIAVSKSVDTAKISATEAAEAYYFLASAGMDAATQIKALPIVARFAQAGMFQMSRATDLLTDAQSALGLVVKGDTAKSLENLVRVSDVLVKANTLANASVEQFSVALTNKAGAALRLLNKDVEEGVAVLAVFADQGKKDAEAGESLNIVLRDLQKAALNNEQTFKKANVSVFDSTGKMRNMADIVEDLENLMLGMSDKQKRATLTMLGFQDKSVSATTALLGTSKAIRTYEGHLRQAGDTTEEVAKKQMNTLWAQLGLLKNRLIALTLSFDSASGEVSKIVKVFDYLVTKLEKVVDWWGGLNDSTKKTITGFVLIVGAAGPVAFALGKLIMLSKVLVPLFVALRTGGLANYFATLSKSAFVAVAAFTALVAVGWYYYSQWENISKQLLVLWERLKLAMEKANVYIMDSFAAGIGKVLLVLDKVAWAIPGLSAKIKSARIEVFKFRADLAKSVLTQQQATAEAISGAKATDGFLTSVKKAISAGKEKLGLTNDTIEATKTNTEVDLAAATATEAAAESQLANAKKLAGEKANFEASLYDKIDSLRFNSRELLDKERGEQLAEAERLGADTYAVKELYSLKAIELEKREAEAKRDSAVGVLNTSGRLAGKIQNVFNKFAQNRLAKLDNEEKKQIAAIENSKLSEEEKELAIQAIRDKTDKKRQELQRKQAKQEKLFSLFQIAINTAAAIVKALPNIPLSVTVGLIGAAELAATAAAPIPFFDGAMIKGSDKGVNAQVGERNQSELIFPLEKGISLITSGIVEKITGLINRPHFGQLSPAIQAPSFSGIRETHLHIGTLIADKRGLKELERQMAKVRIEEGQRKGAF